MVLAEKLDAGLGEAMKEDWVCGLIYHDGGEWLFAKDDWCSLGILREPLPHEKAVHYSSKAKAIEGAIHHQPTFASGFKVFVRNYANHLEKRIFINKEGKEEV